MKEFLTNNVDTIGSVIGLIFIMGFFMVIKYYPEIKDNKWIDLYGMCIFCITIVGSLYVGAEIGKWFVK